jgi:hypothetical protein
MHRRCDIWTRLHSLICSTIEGSHISLRLVLEIPAGFVDRCRGKGIWGIITQFELELEAFDYRRVPYDILACTVSSTEQ